MEATFPQKVRRAGAPARNTRRSACVLARTIALRMARLECSRESAAAAHPQRVPHQTTLCTSLHTSVHLLCTTPTRRSVRRQHLPRVHTTHHAHMHALPVVGSSSDSAAAAAASKHHTAESMQHAAAHPSQRSAPLPLARRLCVSSALSSALDSQSDSPAASLAPARQLFSVSSPAMAAAQFLPAATPATPSPCPRPPARVPSLPPPRAWPPAHTLLAEVGGTA